MDIKIIELKPNQQLIDLQFNGYKLCLDKIPMLEKELHIPPDRVLPDSSNYSFLHARLFSLNNHLFAETKGDKNIVYLVDESWSIKKIHVDNSELQIFNVFHINGNRNKGPSAYNVCLKLVDENIAVFSDGIGKLYVLGTGDRLQNDYWECLCIIDALDKNECGFIIEDVRFHKSDKHVEEIHCLLYNIEKNKKDQFYSALHWLTLCKEGGLWKKSTLKKIVSNPSTAIYYAFFETSCEAIYLLSNGFLQFAKIRSDSLVDGSDEQKKYWWSQTCDEITIIFKIPNNKLDMDSVNIDIIHKQISIQANGQVLLFGVLNKTIDHNQTSWAVENDCLKIILFKQEKGEIWESFVLDDIHGEYLTDACSEVETREKLTHLPNDKVVLKPMENAFNNQEMEDCDFEMDEYLSFERLSGITCETTHKVNISTHVHLLSVQRSENLPPAIALRHDVDAYVWQPIIEEENFQLLHQGTLNAFGYVQVRNSGHTTDLANEMHVKGKIIDC